MFTEHHMCLGEENTVNDTPRANNNPFEKAFGLHIQQGHFPKKLILSNSFPYQKLIFGWHSNVSSIHYNIERADALNMMNKDSEPFQLWITGDAYNEN